MGIVLANMYQATSILFLVSCLSNVFCQQRAYPPSAPPPPPPQYPTPSPVQDYNPDIGQTNVGGYGVNKDPYCHKVETPNCYMEEKTINDVTCTNTVEFNCKREKTTKNDGYGQKEVVCTRTPKQDCY